MPIPYKLGEYRYDDLKKISGIVHNLDEGSLAVFVSQDEERFWTHFAVATITLASEDGKTLYPIKARVFWHGNGPSGGLREMRHSYFGESNEAKGYIFYFSVSNINKAAAVLAQYFDME